MKPAICTQCGARIEVDESKEAGICKNCGTAFITQKAINNYITQNTTVHNVTENVTKIIIGNEKDEASDYFKRGVTQLKLKRYDNAVKQFEKATEKSPERAEYWFYLFYAYLFGFESFIDLRNFATKEAFKNFKTLASESEIKKFEKEFGVYLTSFEDFAYGCLAKNFSCFKTEVEQSLAYSVGEMKLECKNQKIAEEILEKSGNFSACDVVKRYENEDVVFVITSVCRALEKDLKLSNSAFSRLNAVDEKGVLHVVAPRQFLKESVFEVADSKIKKIILYNLSGIEKLSVKDNKIYQKYTQFNKFEKIPVVEIDSSSDDGECIKAAMVLADELLILPEHITTLEPYSRFTDSTDSELCEEDRLMYFPDSDCIIYFKGIAKGGLSHSYKDDGNSNGKTIIEIYRWAYVSNGKVYNCSNDDERIVKYFGKDNNFVEGKEPRSKQGCYIATCVYGSYDCPKVWVLRRYRDFYLKKSAIGSAFVKFYYAVSPKIVKVFGKYKWFNKLFKIILDKKVARLYKNGYENTPYNDN